MADDATKASTLVAFDVGSVSYAIGIHAVREIIRPQVMEPIESPQNAVVGVFDHRGEVVPLIDLRRRLAGEPSVATRQTRWILVEHQSSLLALIVDCVHEVFSSSAENARKVPEIFAGGHHDGIRAAFSHKGRLVFMIGAELFGDLASAEPRASQLRLPSSPVGEVR